MEQRGTKEAAESVLRELPSVVGAFVREDVYGQPREIHLLIAPGPSPRALAQDVRGLLEERLGLPIDQRIISIAQLAEAPVGGPTTAEPEAEEERRVREPAKPEHDDMPRVRFIGAESEVAEGRVTVRARLEWEKVSRDAHAIELEAGTGRVRAGASAVLRGVTDLVRGHGRFELDSAATVRTMNREYALVATLVTSPFLGRRPVQLVGAQEIEHDVETAAALAALKSVNRLVGWIRRLGEVYAEPTSRGSN